MDGWMFSVLTGITISAALRLKRHKLSPLLRRLKITDSDRIVTGLKKSLQGENRWIYN